MIVPSRSTKTAGDNLSATRRIPPKIGQKFVFRHGCGPKFADNDGTSVIGDFGCFYRCCLANESKGKKRDRGIARARNIENLARFSWDVMRRFVFLKKHHAVFAEGDEEIFRLPFFEQRLAGTPKFDIF